MFRLDTTLVCALLCENTWTSSNLVLLSTLLIMNSAVPCGCVLAFIVLHINRFGSLLFLHILRKSGVTLFTIIGTINIDIRLITVHGSRQNST